jgi:hypothetical protein
MVSAEQRLRELAIQLPPAPTPFGAYVPAVQAGNLLFLSGMLPTHGHEPRVLGCLGKEIDVDSARNAARIAALNAIALVRQHLGTLDRVRRVVRLDVAIAIGYLIDRYARRAGKKFSSIGAKTLEAFQKYSWPGNVRELQNVIERAVVLCDGPTFSVDSTWFNQETTLPFNRKVHAAPIDNERALIEDALAETHGRVSGPSGAASKLGITRQTLEYKIRRLGINKHQFQT